VSEAVVSVLGSTRVTGGKVGDSAVAVMGNVYINGEVSGDVVAVFGNVELGPEARVRGDVVVVGGQLHRDPAAVVDGQVQHAVSVDWSSLGWVRPWVDRCVLYGRPLAFGHGLGWAWGIALALLALYAFLAFVFRGAVERCVHTLQSEPGHSVVAALLTVLFTPVLFVLLCITVLGIVAIPFLVIALIAATIFGKIVMLAYIGRRCTPMLAHDPVAHTVVGVMVGGAIVLLIYTIPVIGFIVYKVLGILGLGVVVYTLLITLRAARQGRAGPGGPGVATAGVGGGGPTPRAEPYVSAHMGGGATAQAAGAAQWTAGPSEPATEVPGNTGPTAQGGAGFAGSAGQRAGFAGEGSGVEGGRTGATNQASDIGGQAAGFGGQESAPGGQGSGVGGLGDQHQGTAPGGQGAGVGPGGQASGFGGRASGLGGQPSGPLATSLPRAGFGIRMAALLLDILLVGIVLSDIHKGTRLELLVLATYGAVMWKLKAATIGGIICGLRVVRIDGRVIDWPTAIARALSCFLSLAAVGLGFIWIAIDSERQAWHDKIAGTLVVRAPKGASLL
jgi:uncharacterized RDD family membrane protein YckC